MKPDGALTTATAMDLTYVALEEAAWLMPAAKFYTLTVHPRAARHAASVLGVHLDTVEGNPLSPTVGLQIDETQTDEDEWSLRAGDVVFWSPGA